MDGSNGNNPSNGAAAAAASNAPTQQPRTPPRPGDSSRAVRAELEAQLRAKVEKQRHYWPLVKQQVERVFGDTQPAWYARLRLFTPAMYAAAAGNRVLGLSMQKDRLLSDAEARALTEHAARSSDRLALIDWGLTGVAAYFTWRGRRTLRFPMWTPQVVPPPPGSYLRMAMWHGARYVAYSAALTVTVKAPLMSLNLMREARQTIADERLRGVLDGQDSAAGEWGKAGAAWDSDISSYRASAGGEDAQQQRQRQSIQEAAQSGWNTSKQTEQSPPLPPQQQQQPRQYGQSAQSQGNAGWGSSYSQSPSSSSSSAGWGSDDFDDASPVAASAQNSSRSSNSTAGSTWERLRQHARSDPQQRQQQQQQQQVQPQVQQQHWGDAGDGADRAAQEKAQRDFDRLVERDRQGRSSR
ncbi:hypothetical protein BBO_03035 [Beauveria brongniartii RCEF 3172]|uniref:Uncharacterized protein n=1 Tax=Beauveria brongniartii RCEF 3172 TaxID=1081107 RepID=A0A162LXG5_9HYPO|nr:hypothetical protein BBO_03035 [Beauveria brongniartii RCEF 3172]